MFSTANVSRYTVPFKEVPVQAQRPPEDRFSKEQEVLKRIRSSIQRRDRVPPSEGCHLVSGTQSRRVLLHSVSSLQKEWADEICHQSETAQPELELGLYEEGKVKHINGPTYLIPYQMYLLVHRSKVQSMVGIYKNFSMCMCLEAHGHVIMTTI